MAERLVMAQVDFGGGQVDEDANRREDAKVPKTGARTMSNWRQRNTGTIEVRPGRNAIAFSSAVRAERFRMSSAQELIISFPTNRITISDLSGNVVATNANPALYLWTDSTSAKISWCKTEDRIVICFDGMLPELVLWDQKSNTFTFARFDFGVVGPQINMPFYRNADLGVGLNYPALTGTVLITASAPIFTSAMLNTYLSIGGYQCQLQGFIDSTHAYALVTSPSLPQFWAVAIPPSINLQQSFPLNTPCRSSLSAFVMETSYYSSGGGFNKIVGMLLNNQSPKMFQGDFMVSAFGTAEANLPNTSYASPQFGSVVTWQQQFMSPNNFPRACFFAHQRLGFCDFPARPEAILWSSPGNYDLFWVDSAAAIGNPAAGSAADSAILEFIEGQPRVRNVVEWNGDEFIFTDQGVYYIPVSTGGQALQPGSVRFALISDATCSGIKPAVTRDALIFTSASNDRVSAMIRTGNFTTPYAEQDLTTYHSQLVNNPVTVAVGRGDEGFPERYIFVLNADGSVAVGRMQDDRSFVGWLPWSGAGTVAWLSQGFLNVLFNTRYGSSTYVLELMNSSYFLDHCVKLNSAPANMFVGGNGPFIAFANGTARVMDGAIDYGLRNISATGRLLPNPDDDFSSPTIVAGQPFTSIYSPFMPEAPLGQAQAQRQRLRKITRATASVYNSNGFTFGGRTIPPFNFGDNPFAQPNLNETTYRIRPLGRAFDPTISLVKDNPGPLTLLEFALELTV